jgi:hypothetical protein
MIWFRQFRRAVTWDCELIHCRIADGFFAGLFHSSCRIDRSRGQAEHREKIHIVPQSGRQCKKTVDAGLRLNNGDQGPFGRKLPRKPSWKSGSRWWTGRIIREPIMQPRVLTCLDKAAAPYFGMARNFKQFLSKCQPILIFVIK